MSGVCQNKRSIYSFPPADAQTGPRYTIVRGLFSYASSEYYLAERLVLVLLHPLPRTFDHLDRHVNDRRP
eukprot:COSAG06_NODE_312_length_17767_cov_17.644895_10_plen_70_part_00